MEDKTTPNRVSSNPYTILEVKEKEYVATSHAGCEWMRIENWADSQHSHTRMELHDTGI